MKKVEGPCMKLKIYSKIGDSKFSSKPRTGLVKDVKTKRQPTTRTVSHCGLAIYIKKDLKAKEELWKLKCKKYYLQKTL
jgi:hypothetical protein